MASLSTTYARWDRFADDSDDGAEPAVPAPTAPVASAPALDDDASAPTDDLDPDVARGLDAPREAEPGVCASFLDELATQLHNAPLRKRAAVDRGALQAVVDVMRRHAAHADVQTKGARALRALCFNNALGRAAAPAAGAIRVLADALNAHVAAEAREAVDAASDYDAAVLAGMSMSAEALTAAALAEHGNPPPAALAANRTLRRGLIISLTVRLQGAAGLGLLERQEL